ncbi:MAG: glycerophosphoryl diester phosphodiesterase [Desulforhopalus sp.]|jgi:glycerophosphoryl diester phosphodiesterase
MNSIKGLLYTTLFLCLTIVPCYTHATNITIIREGGGSELIANSLVATTVAVVQGADYLELPINMSADDELIVFKNITLNGLTNVAELFPARHRDDGNYYVIDFNLRELRQLRLKNVFEEDNNSLSLGIPTLREELTVIRKLNVQLGKETGVVIGLEKPSFYTAEGKDMIQKLQQILELLSYNAHDKLFLQSDNPDVLQKISRWPHAAGNKRFCLIQLVKMKENRDTDQMDGQIPQYQHGWLFTNSGLRILASYASAVAFPADILLHNRIAVENTFVSLNNYGIKIFALSSGNDHAFLAQQVGGDMGVPTQATEKTRWYEGIYLDSTPTAPGVATTPEPAQTQNADATPEESTLPPFFSNLGLSQPKHTNTSRGDKSGSKINEEDFN